jgi:hypothetical protein
MLCSTRFKWRGAYRGLLSCESGGDISEPEFAVSSASTSVWRGHRAVWPRLPRKVTYIRLRNTQTWGTSRWPTSWLTSLRFRSLGWPGQLSHSPSQSLLFLQLRQFEGIRDENVSQKDHQDIGCGRTHSTSTESRATTGTQFNQFLSNIGND